MKFILLIWASQILSLKYTLRKQPSTAKELLISTVYSLALSANLARKLGLCQEETQMAVYRLLCLYY